jgi:hypothetical protein
MKYSIMRIRAKISYMAFQKRMTILELFVYTINKCYRHMLDIKAIPPLTDAQYDLHNKVYRKLTNRGIKGMMVNIVEFNMLNNRGTDWDWLQTKMDYLNSLQTMQDKFVLGVVDQKELEFDEDEKFERNAKLIQILHSKDSCLDIFRDLHTVLGDGQNRNRIHYSTFYQCKVARQNKMMTYNVLNMAIKLRAISGLCLFRAILTRIQLARELFIMEIELGQEV